MSVQQRGCFVEKRGAGLGPEGGGQKVERMPRVVGESVMPRRTRVRAGDLCSGPLGARIGAPLPEAWRACTRRRRCPSPAGGSLTFLQK